MTDTPQTRLSLKNFINDMPDQYLFFAFAAVGSFSILFLKTVGLNQFVVTAVPVALIIIYATIAITTRRWRIRQDVVGDNCYYLGFIYTLVSLSFALYAYDPTGAGVDLIITNFGIALMTTIFGLVFRVFFNQMREDPQEVEREVRYALADAARDLRSQLNAITINMEDFKRRMQQIIQEGVVDIQARATATLDANVAAFAGSTKQVVDVVDTTMASYEATSKKMGSLAESLVNAIEALAKRVENVNVSPEMVSAKLDPIIQSLAAIVDDVSKRETGHTKSLQALKRSLDGAVASAGALDSALAAGADSAKDGVEKLLKGSAAAAAGSGQVTEAIQKMISDFSIGVGTFRSEMERLTQAIATERARSVEQAKGLNDDIAAQRAAAAEHVRAMKKMLDDGQEALADLQSALVSLTKTVVEQVRA